jgi:hypothetical protein
MVFFQDDDRCRSGTFPKGSEITVASWEFVEDNLVAVHYVRLNFVVPEAKTLFD